jgi:hexosaminidase
MRGERLSGNLMFVRFCLVLFSIALLGQTAAEAAVSRPPLIPMPVSVEWRDGAVPITGGTVIDASGSAESTGTFLARAMDLKLGRHGSSRIRLAIVPAATVPGPEAYHLRAAGKEVLIEASDPRGLFYGVQTLRQLVTGKSDSRTVPAVEIRDAPRFRWRGLLVDESRHFFGKDTLLKTIDEMAAYKLNVLQLHLTDDPGWRVEIPGYPRLTGVGALDPETGAREYFSTDQIHEIVDYAAERHIMVVPEIEMPGHAGSEARAYPEFFDGQGRFNPGKPETYDFIRNVLSEVGKLFPAPYLHFGGDEVGDDAWQDLPDVARLKSEHGLNTTKDVQRYFGRRVADIIQSIGKRPMAWDEQAEAGADKNVVIFWWRAGRPDVLQSAAKAGYDLVMAPVDQAYFDYHQGPGEPGAPWEGNEGGPISISKILKWEPVPDSFTPDEAAHVLGVEAAVWTEFIKTERYFEFMTYPRLLALAEIAWRPKGPRDEKEFNDRLEPHIEALRAKGINARRGEWDAYEYITN